MLSSQIRQLRTARNLSQVQLAKALGVTKQSVSNWENNNIQPSIDMLVKIARFFSVSTDYLLCLDDRQLLDTSGLSPQVIAHLQQLIDDIRTPRLVPALSGGTPRAGHTKSAFRRAGATKRLWAGNLGE